MDNLVVRRLMNVIFYLIELSMCKCGEKVKTNLQKDKNMIFHLSAVALESLV